MRHRISLLAPHVCRAVAISDIVGRAHRETQTFRALVDGLAAAVVLVDSEGRIVHANHAADALLGRSSVPFGDALNLDRHQLRQLAQRPDTDSSTAIFETDFGTRYVAHCLPLSGGAGAFASLHGDPVVAIFVQPANFDPPSIPQGLARAFDLTPAELRIALATLQHERVADVAENLGVSEATVKTHLSHIFSKTDTRRQADIVKLIAGFSSPLAAR
jgi:DNA-binding CsgD family transcriptional regulator